jgi:nucleoside-diphosphate-sugar epimerase
LKVVVTGSNGMLGRCVAQAMTEAGHEVVGLDVTTPTQAIAWSHITADLTDLAANLQIFPGADAVAHIAGIPRPVGFLADEVFRTNTTLTYNAVEAAILCGVKRLVYASSMSALGYPFFSKPIQPSRLPIDSAQPTQAQDAYGLSKWIGEEIIDAGVRRSDLTAISLRLPWIQLPDGFLRQVAARRARAHRTPCDLWAYIDGRDAGRAFLAALAAPVPGHVRVFVSAGDTFMEEETEALVRTAYPSVPRDKTFQGHESIISLDEARSALGFEARYSWRDYDGAR